MTWPYPFSVDELMRRAREQELAHQREKLRKLVRLRKERPKRKRSGGATCIYCGSSIRRGLLICLHCDDLPTLESEGLL